jgi:hypothetical protein
VEAYDIYLGSRDAKTRAFVPGPHLNQKSVAVPANYPVQHLNRDVLAFEVPVHKGQNFLGVKARTAVGESPLAYDVMNSTVEGFSSTSGTLHILAIGIDKYPKAAVMPELTLASKDAKDFAATAAQVMGSRHPTIDTQILVTGAGGDREPTLANITAALKRMAQAGNDDTTVLFIAGHGINGSDGRYRVLPQDYVKASLSDPGSNALLWDEVSKALANTHGNKLVFLDTCHSANAINDSLAGDARNFAFAAFTAAQANASAKEDAALGNGYFTAAVKQGLIQEAYVDNKVDVYSLGPYVARRVSALSKGTQDAQFYPGSGNMVLAQR